MKQLSLLLIVLSLLGCSQEQGLTIRIDMSREHDEARFNPDLGDKIAIAGSFNDWEANVTILSDPDGDWVYEVKLQEVPDTLDFKFVVNSSTNFDLPNSGWEIIPNRSISVEAIESFEPVFIYNESWKPSKVENILFSVSMSNQEVLEFFDTEYDQVVVSGSFIDWDPNGVVLEDGDSDGIYELEIPIEISSTKPPIFKYRILKGSDFDGYIQNGGWETIDDRILLSAEQEIVYFNNQMRISRFLITQDWLKKTSQKGIERADVFQVRFYIGEESYLSEPLIKNNSNYYEASVAIPMTVDKVKWTIVENQSIELSPIQESVVTHKGAIIRLQ